VTRWRPARTTAFHIWRQLYPSQRVQLSVCRLPVFTAWRARIRPAPALPGPQLSPRNLGSFSPSLRRLPRRQKSSQAAERSSYPPLGARGHRLARPTPPKSDRVHPVRRRSASAQRAASYLPSTARLHHAAPCRATHNARDNGGIGPCSSTLPSSKAHKAPSTSPVEPVVPSPSVGCPRRAPTRRRHEHAFLPVVVRTATRAPRLHRAALSHTRQHQPPATVLKPRIEERSREHE
jgi:hypothetical protein